MTVLTLGTFDLFHAGHVNLLRQCREIAGMGIVVVGLNTDEFIDRYKGRPPVLDYAHRAAVVAACRYVDVVWPNAQADGSAVDVIHRARPDVIVIGSDWQHRDYLGQLGVPDLDVEVRYVPYTESISSSAIRERLTA